MTAQILVNLPDAAAAVLTDEAARAELPLGRAIGKALALWITLRRAARRGARVYLATGHGGDTRFELVEVL